MNNENQAVKDYCEQEGISKDDIINAEIEQEHKEAEARKNVKVEINYAPEDEAEEFSKKMEDKNCFAIEITLTLKLVDFIDISEFNSQQIAGGEYKDELSKFLHEHKRFTPELSDKIVSELKKSGLMLTSLKEEGRNYNPIRSHFEAFKDSLLHGDSNCIEKLLKGITPPPTL